jgi:trimeric autotransporter adhesin
VAILPCYVNAQTAINSNYLLSFGWNAGTLGTDACYYGEYAGRVATDAATNNVLFGYQSGYYLTDGDYNTFLGSQSGRQSTTSSNNTFIGHQSGYYNATGTGNAYIGNYAGYYSTGSNNIFLGMNTGKNNRGDGNTFLGRSAGLNNISGSSNVFIGNAAGYNETGSNKLYIANSNTTTPLIYGDFSTNLININGKLGVGIASGNFTTFMAKNTKLGVNGTISATEVVVAAYANWPDFVFNADYKLNTLSEVEAFVKANKHLPGVPLATEVEKEGVALGEMNKILLQKVEELTLYMIAQQKEIEAIKSQLNNVQK